MSGSTAIAGTDVALGFLAAADAPGAPGVVLLHDVWQLSDHYRELATRLAARGFSVLALDLYRGSKHRRRQERRAVNRASSAGPLE